MRSQYYSKVLIPFVNYLIRFYSNETSEGLEVNLNDLDDLTKQQFAAHLFENDNRDLSCLVDSKDSENVSSQLVMLLNTEDKEEKIDFAERIQKIMVSFYEKQMRKLLEDKLEEYNQDTNYYPSRARLDVEHGVELRGGGYA